MSVVSESELQLLPTAKDSLAGRLLMCLWLAFCAGVL